VVLVIESLTSNLADNGELFEMSKEEGDEDGLKAIHADVQTLSARSSSSSSAGCSATKPTRCNCFVDIQAGAGGTEACDWASMLLRQYVRYCERKGFKAELEDETAGDVAGIKSATIKVEGDYAFGLLAHRNRRASPGAQVAV
jgi:peptide chain release factor 2